MKYIHSCPDLITADAFIFRLQEQGIHASIENEALKRSGAAPSASGAISILVVDDDFKKARKLINSWGEKTVAQHSFSTSAPVILKERAYAFIFISLLTGFIAGYVMRYGSDMGYWQRAEKRTEEFDMNGDGKVDAIYHYKGWPDKFAYEVEIDRNFDGKIDLIQEQNSKGIVISDKADNDFNGTFETQDFYEDGVLARSEVDTDGDNKPDTILIYEKGILSKIQYINPKTDKPVKTEYYKNFRLQSADYDADGDGVEETHFTYDAYGQVIKTESLGIK